MKPDEDITISDDAERSVLGGLLIDNGAIDRIGDLVKAEDFHSLDHANIYRVIEELILGQSKAADTITVAERLRDRGLLEKCGGFNYLRELSQFTPGAGNIRLYAEMVRERSVRRQVIRVAHWLREKATTADGTDAKELVDQAQKRVLELSEVQHRGESGPIRAAVGIAEVMDYVDELHKAGGRAVVGTPTGLDDLDELTCGMEPGNLIVLAARPSMGKSALALNVAEHVSMTAKLPVLFFSLEMTMRELSLRLLSSGAGLQLQRVRVGRLYRNEWDKLGPALAKLHDAPLYIDATPSLSANEMRIRARRLARETGGLGLIVIDYLQMVQADSRSDNRANEIAEVSRALKGLGKELACPVIALSQLNRGLENRPNKRPVMSDLRESGAIEQDADLILFIYRDEVYNKESEARGRAEIIVAKQRNGPIGTVEVAFNGNSTRFENLPDSSIASSFRAGREHD